MNKIKSFSNFIVEKSSTEMMDYVMDISTKPDTGDKGIVVDTSNNPLWNQIWSGLSTVGKPKKITWKDDWGSGVGRASLNWGTHSGRGNRMGAGSVGLSVDSYSQYIMVTVQNTEEIEEVMNALKPFNFPKIDAGGGTKGQLITVNYSGMKDSQKVIGAVKAVLSTFGLA